MSKKQLNFWGVFLAGSACGAWLTTPITHYTGHLAAGLLFSVVLSILSGAVYFIGKDRVAE